MPAPENSGDDSSSAARADGLTALAPDFVEQDFPEEIDNSVPAAGYQKLPMVGLGGSAGGIEALQRFFEAMPPDSGMAFVVILHLSPEHESILPEMLQRTTTMRVVAAEDEQPVEANCVYVIPPGKFLAATDGHLKLTKLARERAPRMTVDLFFRSLADTYGPHAAAIVLSGADGDGAQGIKRIKERGGLTIAQDPAEAEHPSMPNSAIETGMIDWVLQVAAMPRRLVAYRAQERKLRLPPEEGAAPELAPAATTEREDEQALLDVLSHLRARTGRDFSCYKRATIVRRVARRLQVNGLETMPEYLQFLRTHPGEAGGLQQDLLISVTNFFRDRDHFEALENLIPSLFAGRSSAAAVRVWVPACATGEEAYSIAMLLHEHAGMLDSPPAIQVFATDLDEDAIALAREGLYLKTIANDVSEERLRRFFTKEAKGYRARRDLRESVVFAVHDLLRDAPFSRLDVISCRNLLIYLKREAQMRALEIFHFSLAEDGLLFLGSSESVEEESVLYAPLDKKHRLFRRRAAARKSLPVPVGPGALRRAMEQQERGKSGPMVHGATLAGGAAAMKRVAGHPDLRRVSWEELHFKLIERFAPPSVIVDRDYEIVHVSENAGRFLRFGGGEPSVNLMRVVDPLLAVELRSALFRAAQSNAPVEVFNVPGDLDGKPVAVDLRVAPAQEIAPDFLLVVFSVREVGGEASVQFESEPAVRHLDRELEQMKSRLRDTVEQYEASTEELKAGNEELQAMNEELRSATEELETSREELQSINEELITVNAELKGKVDELAHANADLNNLMAATAVATIFLDRKLTIVRYTPSAVELFRFIPSDLGRPLTDLRHALNYPELLDDAQQVLRTLIPVKREVGDGQGHWYLAQILPYRTEDDRIAGAVLAFIDITEMRGSQQALAASRITLERQMLLFDTTLSTITDFAYRIDRNGRFVFANKALLDLWGLTLEEAVGKNFHELGYEPELAARLHRQIDQVLATGETLRDTTAYTSHEGAQGFYEYIFTAFRTPQGEVEAVVGWTRDITAHKQVEQALRESQERLRLAQEAGEVGIWDWDIARGESYWSETLWRLFGYEAPPAGGPDAAWQGQLEPADRRRVDDNIARLLASAETEFRDWFRIRRADGQMRWLESVARIARDAEGRAVRMMGVNFDVTARKESEAALGASEERLRLIVENARDYAILSLSLERQITSWNSGAEQLIGLTAEEAIGRTGDLIFTAEDREAGVPEAEAEQALHEGRAADERWHLRSDGSRFWGSGVMMAMHDSAGQAIGLVKIFRDQTAEREAQQTLEQSRLDLWQAFQETERARAEAEAAGQAKDHFLAVLSHELRTPLTPISMATQALARRKDLPEPVRDALAMIRRNIQLESRLVDDLLDVTKIERGKMELIRERIDLHTVIEGAVETTLADFHAKNQRLSVALGAAEHSLEGDAGRLQQVVWNLLRNASKFSPAQSEIQLTSRNEPGWFLLDVADTGIGIDPEALPRIFDPFSQADASITRKFGGLGLGLAIARSIAAAHNGELRVASDGHGHGATFTVALPLHASS